MQVLNYILVKDVNAPVSWQERWRNAQEPELECRQKCGSPGLPEQDPFEVAPHHLQTQAMAQGSWKKVFSRQSLDSAGVMQLCHGLPHSERGCHHVAVELMCMHLWVQSRRRTNKMLAPWQKLVQAKGICR